METEDRIRLLAAHLECDADEITETSYDDTELEYGNESYLVLDDDEADDALVRSVEQSLWAFNADFLRGETGLPAVVFEKLSELCEDANEAVEAIVEKTVDGGVRALATEAARHDGRGHFLAGYDGDEVDLTDPETGMVVAYAYRIN